MRISDWSSDVCSSDLPHCQVSRQLRRCTASCNGIATPNIGDEGRFGRGERPLELEGQTVFIDSEHGCRIEQRKTIYQVSRSSEPSIIAWVKPATTGRPPAPPTTRCPPSPSSSA